jgi:hypothetical protein
MIAFNEIRSRLFCYSQLIPIIELKGTTALLFTDSYYPFGIFKLFFVSLTKCHIMDVESFYDITVTALTFQEFKNQYLKLSLT